MAPFHIDFNLCECGGLLSPPGFGLNGKKEDSQVNGQEIRSEACLPCKIY